MQRVGRDLGERQLADADRRFQLVGRRLLADDDEIVDVGLLFDRDTDLQAGETERIEDLARG